MNFILNGYDYKDEKSLERRMAAREGHVKNIEAMKNDKKILMACAMLNSDGNMCGSTLILEMENKEAVDEYLKTEAYVLEKVWERVEVIECKIPPMFL